MPHSININGKLLPAAEAGVPADSRAFRYGYGLFETMLVRDGNIRLADYHWDRLREGMALMQIAAAPHLIQELAAEVDRTTKRNGHEALSRVRLQVWPGDGGLYDGEAFKAQYAIETFPLDEAILSLNENGLVVGIAKGIVKSVDTFSHIKSCSALPYTLAARQAKDALWNDALLLNAHGNIADSTIANVFGVADRKIYTPPLSDGCVAGTMRRYLIEVLPRLGYEVIEVSLNPADIPSVSGYFLTNAIRGIRWIRELDGNNFPPGLIPELHTCSIKAL